MDVTKIKPSGAWVLLKVEPPPRETDGGIYLVEGSAMERLGRAVGLVLAVGPGHTRKKGPGKYTPCEVTPGDRVTFRGHLQELNRPGGVLDRDHCLIHEGDLDGVLSEDSHLSPSLPYDN